MCYLWQIKTLISRSGSLLWDAGTTNDSVTCKGSCASLFLIRNFAMECAVRLIFLGMFFGTLHVHAGIWTVFFLCKMRPFHGCTVPVACFIEDLSSLSSFFCRWKHFCLFSISLVSRVCFHFVQTVWRWLFFSKTLIKTHRDAHLLVLATTKETKNRESPVQRCLMHEFSLFGIILLMEVVWPLRIHAGHVWSLSKTKEVTPNKPNSGCSQGKSTSDSIRIPKQNPADFQQTHLLGFFLKS